MITINEIRQAVIQHSKTYPQTIYDVFFYSKGHEFYTEKENGDKARKAFPIHLTIISSNWKCHYKEICFNHWVYHMRCDGFDDQLAAEVILDINKNNIISINFIGQ